MRPLVPPVVLGFKHEAASGGRSYTLIRNVSKSDNLPLSYCYSTIFTALHCTQQGIGDRKSVRPSVQPSTRASVCQTRELW